MIDQTNSKKKPSTKTGDANRRLTAHLIKPASVLTIMLLAGCATKLAQLPEEADVRLPEKWQTPESLKEASKPDQPITFKEPISTVVESGWLKSFADPELKSYVQTALDNNPDLLSSAARLKSAIEQVTVTGSNLWPNLNANVRSTRTDTEFDGDTTEIRTVSGTLDISWEADIWGKLTQRKRAAAYAAQAEGELYKAAELSLVANVSRAWFNLVTNRLQLELAHQRLESFKRTAALIEENYQRGLRSALDVYLSRTDVQVQISSLSDAQFDYIQSLRAFKTLLGEYPNTELEFTANLPTLSDPIPAGLPAELLTRRPDIKASRFSYKSEIANAKAANRDRYPSINFTGSIGDSRDSFNKLFENDSMILTLISGITQPVFQAGALKSREEQARFSAEAAYANLVKTTLNAFEEVENSLSRESLLLEQHRAIKEAVDFAKGGLDLALDRYQSGIENYTTVLESQRRMFDSKRTEINIRNALLQNRIGIHLSLGGDFSDVEGRDPMADLPSPIKSTDEETAAAPIAGDTEESPGGDELDTNSDTGED